MRTIFDIIAVTALSLLMLIACGNVDNVTPTAGKSSSKFTVGGTVSGLTSTGLVLQNNNGDDLVVITNGTFTFATRISNGKTYSVTIKTQPFSPAQDCVASGDKGTISGANVISVSVVCNTAAALPRSGQTKIYATGDDGDLHGGVAWPNTRFTAVSNGTGTVITDNLTGLIWQQDGSTPTVGLCTGGSMNWQDAIDYAACLNANSYLGHSDWRLPNVNELLSLVNYGVQNPASWLDSQGFANTQPMAYWSSTTYAPDTTSALVVGVYGIGIESYYNKTSTGYIYVRCVRGQSGSFGNSTISIPKTGQAVSYASGDDGAIQAGTGWPSTRFSVVSSGSGTVVKDNLTALIWQQDGTMPTFELCTGGGATWQGALDYVACLNANSYLGYNDWRLPNINEHNSLINYSQSNQATWLDSQGFTATQPSYYWSSTTEEPGLNIAWDMNFIIGFTSYFNKTPYAWYVRCVRGGK
jgi:hypothetical protein